MQMKSLMALATLALAMTEPAGAAEPELKISRAGNRPINAAPAQNFTGNVKVEMLYTPVGAQHGARHH
jgi:4-carboxymuconolactone decarboxylase